MSISNNTGDVAPAFEPYPQAPVGFRRYLHRLGDELFPFGGYRDYQDEILYESLEALFVDDYDNVIIDGPTGIGKSPINITIARVISFLYQNKQRVEEYFQVQLSGLNSGNSFYTTPQKQLRNQLAEDNDLQGFVQMLKSRRDYICDATGENCNECEIKSDPDESCRTTAGCTYWGEKMAAIESDIAVLTFAMLVIDNQIPPKLMNEFGQEERISFDDRDLVIVDEGHNLEGQVASLFAGYSVSSWGLPDEVFGNAGEKVSWDADRFEDVSDVLLEIEHRAEEFIEAHEDLPNFEIQVEQCENFLRKIGYCRSEVQSGRPWVVNVTSLADTKKKKIEIKPVDVDKFLEKFIWSRGTKRVISSATIPYRDNIEKWAERIGLPGTTKLISRPMPFPEENRLIHKNTTVASMSGDGEENNWHEVVETIETIAEKHDGEKGLIHTTSYQRAKKVAESLGVENVIVHNWDYKNGEWEQNEKETSVTIQEWQDSEKDILLSPSMMEGVDLHDDLCRWQVLMKVPYGYIGDSRVSYLLNERHDWEWYNQTTMLNVMQSVGRAVRGPDDAASYYVIDGAFEKLMNKVTTPSWFDNAIREKEPKSWGNAGLEEFA